MILEHLARHPQWANLLGLRIAGRGIEVAGNRRIQTILEVLEGVGGLLGRFGDGPGEERDRDVALAFELGSQPEKPLAQTVRRFAVVSVIKRQVVENAVVARRWIVAQLQPLFKAQNRFPARLDCRVAGALAVIRFEQLDRVPGLSYGNALADDAVEIDQQVVAKNKVDFILPRRVPLREL